MKPIIKSTMYVHQILKKFSNLLQNRNFTKDKNAPILFTLLQKGPLKFSHSSNSNNFYN